jgi:hypothetical protein
MGAAEHCRRQVSRDDRAGRGADERLTIPQVDAGAVLDAGQNAHHPGLAEHAAAAQHQHVRSRSHPHEASRVGF